ncbi:adaptin N terminal region-domain-containing protein [Lipomyces oligophaga]|uniref:adaptin N terminal region-domain-containing protein n=1 Tax=Lipomyces oligophaga TaxID=45792 RepID=UPI0034CF5080
MAEVFSYTLVHEPSTADQPSVQDLKFQLERGNDPIKVEAMKRILVIMLNGDPMPQLLMHVIRFVMPSKSKSLKKLLQFYWEICPKHNPDGKTLKQEMILVCNAIRNDLQHPNEYIRGATLRFLGKLKEPELLEPLIPSVRSCLEHRHAYVRKNAVFAVYSIFSISEHLIPDAAELVTTFLQNESDTTCKRNAFIAISNIHPEAARQYLLKSYTGIPSMDELLQLAFIEFIRKDALTETSNKGRYLRLVFDLLEASSNTVVYEAASALTSLTNNPVAIKAAAGKYIDLSIKESDNNVKLIVLERVDQLRKRHEGVLDDLVMEILRVLSSPDLDVRKKALDISLEMISSKNVQAVILLLKKELQKTLDHDYDKNVEYRQLLIHCIHQCAIKFAEVAAAVVDLLMDFIADFNNASAADIITFVKEVVEKYPALREPILARLITSLGDVRSGKVFRGALWIIGQYSTSEDDIKASWKEIRQSIGEIPILSSEQRLLDSVTDSTVEGLEEEKVNGSSKPKPQRKVLPDGTYATESALTSDSASAAKLEAVKSASKPPLRQLILDGDYYLASSLASALTKLVLRYSEISSDEKQKNLLRAEAMLILISVLRVGQSNFVKAPIDEDSVDRIMSCIKSLSDLENAKMIDDIFLEDTHLAFHDMVVAEESKRADKDRLEKAKSAIQVDDSLGIRQLSKKATVSEEDAFEIDITKATGSEADTEDLSSKLNKVVQLTGFSDTVYAEAYVKVHQFDIVLDVLLVNQTTDTLQNLCVEFATLGDLKVVEKPTTQNLGPHAFYSVQATIKVSSTDTGVIFGNIVYDGSSSLETNIVILNDVHVDIMDYIHPGTVTETQFRTMWTEFEWENKVNINTNSASSSASVKDMSLKDYLDGLVEYTNMSVLTPAASLKGDCQFLSANMYAKSVFGEDALANLSIEKEPSGSIVGHIRIRSKGQGLALSLGDRIAASQRSGSH